MDGVREFIQPNWHVAVVHFPIALVAMGVVVEFFSFLFRRSTLRQAGRWMILLGTICSVPVLLSGLYAWQDLYERAAEMNFPIVAGSEADNRLRQHLWFNVGATSAMAVVVFLWIAASDAGRRLLHLPLLVIALAATGAMLSAAHLGGNAVYTQGVGVTTTQPAQDRPELKPTPPIPLPPTTSPVLNTLAPPTPMVDPTVAVVSPTAIVPATQPAVAITPSVVPPTASAVAKAVPAVSSPASISAIANTKAAETAAATSPPSSIIALSYFTPPAREDKILGGKYSYEWTWWSGSAPYHWRWDPPIFISRQPTTAMTLVPQPRRDVASKAESGIPYTKFTAGTLIPATRPAATQRSAADEPTSAVVSSRQFVGWGLSPPSSPAANGGDEPHPTKVGRGEDELNVGLGSSLPLLLAVDSAAPATPTFEKTGLSTGPSRVSWAADAQKYSDKVTPFLPPKQVHMMVAGFSFALAWVSLALAVRAITSWPSENDPNVSSEAIAAALSTTGEPRRFVSVPLANEVPAGRFWLLAALLGIVASLTGWWYLADQLHEWDPRTLWNFVVTYDSDYRWRSRRFLHVVVGVSVVGLTILLALFARFAPRRKVPLAVFGLLLLLAMTVQGWLGGLMLFNGVTGPPNSWVDVAAE